MIAQVNKVPVNISQFDLNFPVCCPGLGECGQNCGTGGSGPAGCSQCSHPGRRGDQGTLPESDGEVLQTAGCAGGPHLSVRSLGQTRAGALVYTCTCLLHPAFSPVPCCRPHPTKIHRLLRLWQENVKKCNDQISFVKKTTYQKGITYVVFH